MAGKQATNWGVVKVWMDGLDKQLSNMPAPPVPRDSWSEKVNNLWRCMEGMREQLASELEQEDFALQAKKDEAE